MSRAYITSRGPADDLEIAYLHHPGKTLPDPKGLPFHLQGQPIYFDQPHVTYEQVEQATQYKTSNPFPYGRFIGVGLNGSPPRQINQPDFLSINDDIYLQ